MSSAKSRRRTRANAEPLSPPTPAQEMEAMRLDLLSAARKYGQGTRTPTYGAREARLDAELTANLLHSAKLWVAAVKVAAADHHANAEVQS